MGFKPLVVIATCSNHLILLLDQPFLGVTTNSCKVFLHISFLDEKAANVILSRSLLVW